MGLAKISTTQEMPTTWIPTFCCFDCKLRSRGNFFLRCFYRWFCLHPGRFPVAMRNLIWRDGVAPKKSHQLPFWMLSPRWGIWVFISKRLFYSTSAWCTVIIPICGSSRSGWDRESVLPLLLSVLDCFSVFISMVYLSMTKKTLKAEMLLKVGPLTFLKF